MAITINDPLETLTIQQADALRVKAAAYPFDIHVTIVSNLSSKPLFESQVAAMVTGPKTLAIGVDPQHHFTYVRGSADLGLPNGPEVAAAGNHYFRKGDLVTGIDSIAARANDLRVSARLVSSQAGDPIIVHQHQTAVVVWWILGTTVALTAVTLVYLWLRNRRRERDLINQTAAVAEEAAELRGRNLEEGVWHDRMRDKADNNHDLREAQKIASAAPVRAPYQAPAPSYTPFPAPAPAPIIVNNPAPNNSGLDMLIGYELGRSESPRVVERETVVVEPDRSGSGSSWSGGDSGSSSSTDWGSSSDSSSSSDWGGGGSDSGSSGGGGDW